MMSVGNGLVRGSRSLSQQLTALDSLLAEARDPAHSRFLRDYRFQVAEGILAFESVDALHLGLFEEWHLVRSKAPWVDPSFCTKTKTMCCHFKKSTEQRPLLEAECRRKGIEVAPGVTRLGLAALLEPDLPAFCAKHVSHAPTKRRTPTTVFMRGHLARDDAVVRLRGVWSLEDTVDAWASARADPTSWSFDYESRGGLFEGFFKVGATVVVETNLSLSIRDGAIQGHGRNDYGAFKMQGHATPQGDLFLRRDYADDDAPTTPNHSGDAHLPSRLGPRVLQTPKQPPPPPATLARPPPLCRPSSSPLETAS